VNIGFGGLFRPIPVVKRPKTWVCGRSLAGIKGSGLAWGKDSVSFECCVLLGRGFLDVLITRPEESYRTCGCVCMCMCVIECDHRQQLASIPTVNK
jgi:hypothetical protein